MELKTILKKYPVFILGLYFLSLGIVLIVRSALGTTPISSINYVLSINSALSLGTWTFIFNLLLIAGQFWLIRDRYSRRDIPEILLQIPFSFLFAAFIDFNMLFTGQLHPGSYGLSTWNMFVRIATTKNTRQYIHQCVICMMQTEIYYRRKKIINQTTPPGYRI